MFKTFPGVFAAIHFRPSDNVKLKVPCSTMPTTAVNAVGVNFSVRAIKFPAALFTSVSTAPNSLSAAPTAFSTASKSRTSASA